VQPFVKPLVLSFSASRYGNPTTFGESIRKARFEKDLRQKDVAQAIGMDEMTVANWESYDKLPVRGSPRSSGYPLSSASPWTVLLLGSERMTDGGRQ
jgi:hypothetical protein